MPVLNSVFGKVEYRQCVPADIGRHYEQIKHWITDTSRKEFEGKMLQAIEEGSAWCTENTFLYYVGEGKGIVYGAALYGHKHPQELMSLFVAVFWFHDKRAQKLRFKLHQGKTLQEYKTLLSIPSIRRVHMNEEKLAMIRVDKLRKRMSSWLRQYT